METQNSKPQHLNIVVKTHQIAVFFRLIESGFRLKIKSGLSIRELFCDHLGVSEEHADDHRQIVSIPI